MSEEDAIYPTLDGCVRLISAFWRTVRADLKAGDRRVLAWLASPAFEEWVGASVGTVSVDTVRDELRSIFGAGLPYRTSERYFRHLD